MVVTTVAAMGSEFAGVLVDLFVIGGYKAAVAITTQVLRRIEAESTHQPQSTGTFSTPCGAECLGRVLDDLQLVVGCDLSQRIHVRTLAVQVDGHQALDLGR